MSHSRPAACAAWLCATLLVAALSVGCTSTRTAERGLTAEEQVLMARLTRDPYVVVDTWQRDDDGYLVVTTKQGAATSRYIFKPERPGERRLTIHHIEDVSRLDTAGASPYGTGPQPNWTGRYR